jgi:chromosomal replication initiation ATPase DnaA
MILRTATSPAGTAARVSLETLATRLAASHGVAVSALLGKTRTAAAVKARHILAYIWVEVLGRHASDLARVLGQTRGNVSWAARHGAALAGPWQADIPRWCR